MFSKENTGAPIDLDTEGRNAGFESIAFGKDGHRLSVRPLFKTMNTLERGY